MNVMSTRPDWVVGPSMNPSSSVLNKMGLLGRFSVTDKMSGPARIVSVIFGGCSLKRIERMEKSEYLAGLKVPTTTSANFTAMSVTTMIANMPAQRAHDLGIADTDCI